MAKQRLLKKKNPLKALDLDRLAKAADLNSSARRSDEAAAATIAIHDRPSLLVFVSGISYLLLS